MDSNKIKFAKVKKCDGNRFLSNLKNISKGKSILNKNFKTIHEKDYILFPLNNDSEVLNFIRNEFFKKISFEIVEREGEIKPNLNYQNIEDYLKEKIPKNILELIPHSYDLIGDIAIIEFDRLDNMHDISQLGDIKKEISKAMLKVHKNIKTIYEKIGPVKGEYRLRGLKHILGPKKTETLIYENKCVFKLDVKKTFFTPRLVFERKRISNLPFEKNEIIVDMFSGVGPFAIQIAKNQDVIVHAFDINPWAIYYLNENILLNKLKGKILAYNIDIKSLLKYDNPIRQNLENKIHRIIMNLPERALEFIDIAKILIKKSGAILHIYLFSEKPDSIEKGIFKSKKVLNQHYLSIEKILNKRIVKPYSPRIDLIVLDVKVKNENI